MRISFFNGNGKLISATYVNCTDPSEENGIYINGFDNIVITNVNVNMGCKGILVDNSENIIIKDSTFSDLQSQTITLLNAVGVQISNNVLDNNKMLGMHTLFLLDLDTKNKKFLTINEACRYLISKNVDENSLAIGCTSLGTEQKEIKFLILET